jgi:hypothetical protein
MPGLTGAPALDPTEARQFTETNGDGGFDAAAMIG